MIPKIIHFCWFGGNPLPPLALECIASWRRFLPEYEIWMWKEVTVNGDGLTVNGDGLTVNDEGVAVNGEGLTVNGEEVTVNGEGLTVNGDGLTVNGDGLTVNGKDVADKVMEFDVDSIPYTEEAYRQRKYAYVSDYARFEIIYRYGGIYFDTDVEVIRPMEDIIAKGCFMGFEQDPDGDNTPGKYAPRYCYDVALGLGFGMTPRHPFMREMMEYYKSLTFEPIPSGDIAWYKTIVAHTTEKLCARGLKNVSGIQLIDDMYVYPSEYFAPINAISRRLHITENTRTVHRYMASWSERRERSWKDYVQHYIPEWVYFLNNRIKRRRYRVGNR